VSLRERLAAIDVGSNTILLLIAEHDPAAGLTIIKEAEDQPRLGAGLGDTGRLGQASMERALRSLERMRELCREHGVTRITAVATAAVREAANGDEFVQQARRIGIPLQTISPEAEAELAYRSAAHHFPGDGRMLVADIGGGSLELIGAVEARIELVESLPLGAVRLTERRRPLDQLRLEVSRELGRVIKENGWSHARVIGSGGTFANLARMILARRGETINASVQGTEIFAEEVESLLAELARMDSDQRRRVPGLEPERADIIVAGLVVVTALMQAAGAGSAKVNVYGLREGVLLEMLGLPSGSVPTGDQPKH
jgi:exopolyphosphatase/guanosine-5'-triphosphate,3'-diphosphate pyrophosphatase